MNADTTIIAGRTSSAKSHLERSATTNQRAIAEFAQGRFLLVSDDEDRENEGDLVIAASFATPASTSTS